MEETNKNGTAAAWEHVCAAGDEVRKTVGSMLPPEVREHGRAARREMLLAVRSLLDAAINHLDRVQARTSS